MSYRSPSAHVPGSPFGKQIPDGPIREFALVVEKTSPEDWQKRTQAFVRVVSQIPHEAFLEPTQAYWYNSPPTLRHLAWPLSELLKDPRSTVVKITCEASKELFSKCGVEARYLLKDIMPTILGVHAQTVAVIRASVQDMTLHALSVSPCKMAMPIWLDRLKGDKSRTVREACCLYLGVGLAEWTDPGYLSQQIWEQVGSSLVRALRDSAPGVRQHSKKGLETLCSQQPAIFNMLVDNVDNVRDARVRKLLGKIQAGESVDDISVASSRVGSVSSRNNFRAAGGSIAGSVRRAGSKVVATPTSRASYSVSSGDIPRTIGVSNSPVAQPKRSTSLTVGGTKRTGGGLGPPVRLQGPFQSAVDSPKKGRRGHEPVPNSPATDDASDRIQPTTALSNSFDTADTAGSDLPVIVSADALREFAKSRGSSRRSSMLQERFARSASLKQCSDNEDIATSSSQELEDAINGAPTTDKVDTSAVAESRATIEPSESMSPIQAATVPEHKRIAQDLLEAHKKHVDQVMETLKVEMDALKEFELLLLEGGEERPTEDEVLEYFESVGLCIDQRAKAGNILLKKMDKISKGI
eukprot:Nitzschia sp. Nitz4//scaffold1_size375055//109697//111439//NITZ4_000243-RA/size375055-processed-gene-0.334-mRNA-1//1//CDS//3329540946//8947//frame0